MNSRERLTSAMAGQPTDCPAVAPCYLDLYLNDRVRSYYMEAYERKLNGRARCAIDHAEDVQYRADAILRAYDTFTEPPDWIHVAYSESYTWAERGEIRAEDGHYFYVDRFTGERQDLAGPNALLLPHSLAFIDANDAHGDVWDGSAGLWSPETIAAAVPVRSVEELEAEGFFDVARNLVEKVGTEKFLRCETGTPYWFSYTVLGFQGMMVMMHEQPALFNQIMECKHRQRLEVCKGFARAGVHGVWVEEALSSADLISPHAYERLAFETTRAYIADLNRCGFTTILYYCGDVMSRLPWLRRMGAAALAVEESKKGFTVDIGRVIEGVDGACAVFGNVDAIQVVQQGTVEALEAEVGRQLAAGQKARGFVVCQGSPIPLDTAPARVDQLVRAARGAPPTMSTGY